MIKSIVLSLGLVVMASGVNAETIEAQVGNCIDMEYYDDILHYSEIDVVGYFPNDGSIFDNNGNPDISDVILEKGKVYVAKFNIYENTVCIRKTSNEEIKIFMYEDFNPWENM